MGEITSTHFTRIQTKALTFLAADPYITSSFYLTGGTALAACYLNHRESEDIDLFSLHKVDETIAFPLLQRLAHVSKATLQYAKVSECHRFDLVLPKNIKLKIDLNYYPYPHIEPTMSWHGLFVDSIADIAVNKVLTITQRTTSKDYVDLYFLLKNYTFWDLMPAVKHKFGMEIDPFYLTSVLAQVETLDTLPIMKKKLTLETLKKFFLTEAKKLAMTMVRP